MESVLTTFRNEIKSELQQILSYWEQFSVDSIHGGFTGRVDEYNKPELLAPKGSVLNARILWTFSAAGRLTGDPVHLALAARAYHYIRDYMTDPVFGGLYWSVDYQGGKLDGRKQVYAQAFGIYGMSEYYRLTKDIKSLELAFAWRQLIENFSRDLTHGGYIDAFAEDWTFLDDKRLSEKDENASKTMNTHLHVLEAYVNLYEVSPSADLRKDIISLLQIFEDKIINTNNHHLGLFFNNNWESDAALISYGHDIEAAWLLLSCAESIQHKPSIETATTNGILISRAAMEGLDTDGGLWYEYNGETKELIREKHWWPQAEALVGFCNAWQITGNDIYQKAMFKTWHFIKHHIRDAGQGEWIWGIDGHGNKMAGQDKVGLWKCPYHNSRACLEILRRLVFAGKNK